jgi:N-acetylglucosaminyl-diphospho-decaprenol L-rhamnosyltransferase
MQQALNANRRDTPSLTVSIISHGHGSQVARLLGQLGQLPAECALQVVVTLNQPALDANQVFADAALAVRLNLLVLRNAFPLGFGANHNQAFKACIEQNNSSDFEDTRYFCVLNPDIELPTGTGAAVVRALTHALAPAGVGMAYPSQVDASGELLDFERALATPWAIAKRQLGLGHRALGGGRVDWVNGAFMVFKPEVFLSLGGFDERYFMYCEDVDICLRLQLAGYRLAPAHTTVVHHTQRRTLKSRQHLAWHLRSLLRLWSSRAYYRYLAIKNDKKENDKEDKKPR